MEIAQQQDEGGHFRIMADKSEAALTIDDLEDILYLVESGFLDNDDDFIKEIEEIVAEVPGDGEIALGFKCNVFEKAYRSRRGLARHFNSKHGKVYDRDTGTASGSAGNMPSSLPLSLSSSADEISLQKLHPLQLKAIVLRCAEKVFLDECHPPSFRQKFAKKYSFLQMMML